MIPVFHMEAGNRCFDQRVPEELNRKIVDHLSDINMPLTEQARDYLIKEGIRPETIIKTGSCMKEILTCYKEKNEFWLNVTNGKYKMADKPEFNDLDRFKCYKLKETKQLIRKLTHTNSRIKSITSINTTKYEDIYRFFLENYKKSLFLYSNVSRSLKLVNNIIHNLKQIRNSQ